MATNDMKLTGTNQAQNQYLSYYNQTQKYLGANAPTIQAPQIQAPQALQYQAVAAPSRLNANLIQAPSQLNAAQIANPGAVKTAQVATPGTLQATQIGNLGNLKVTNVATPGALQAAQIANPGAVKTAQVATPGALQAAQVASPGTLQASLVSAPTTNLSAPTLAAPDKINVERINADMQTQAELANQIAAYLRPYTESAINARRQQTVQNRAAIDVDAASRGMGSSTWVTDAKLRQAQAEASDITNLENQYLSNLYQGVFNADQAQQERAFNAAVQNASNALTANVNYAKLLQDYNTTKADLDWQARSSAAQYAYDAAKTNAANQMAAGEFNIGNKMSTNQLNAQLAQQAAMETYGARNNAALENANILNAAYQLGYTTQAQANEANAQLRQQAAMETYGARNAAALQNAAAANNAAQAMYSANANRLTENAQLAQQAAMATYDARNTAALQNAGILNDAYRLGYSTQAGVNEANAQLRQAANLAYFDAMNERNAQNAAYLNQFAMYNNDNAYNARIAERAYRDALAAQGLEWAYDADQFNAQMAYNAAVQNADLWTTLQQLAWNRANDLYGMNPVTYGPGTVPDTDEPPVTPPVNFYYAPYSERGPAPTVADVNPGTASNLGWRNTVTNLVMPSVKDGAASTPSSTKTSKTGKNLPPLNKPSKK